MPEESYSWPYHCCRTSLNYLTASSVSSRPSSLTLSVTYHPGGGLCNQLVGVINTFAVAYAAQAAVQLQSSAYRDSFNTLYHDIDWTASNISTILNVASMRQYWSHQGVDVHDCINVAETADASTASPGLVTEMRLQDQPSRTLLSVANRVHAAALTRVAEVLDDQAQLGGKVNVLVDLGWPAERIKISSHSTVFSRVLKSVTFAPVLEQIVLTMIRKLHQISPTFNGVHLRIENDYVHHPYLDHQGTCNDSLHCLETQFVPAMQRANFSQAVPLYIASAIFMSQPKHQFHVLKRLASFGSEIVYKEVLADKTDLEHLNSEQLAAIDFMLMCQTSKFVGVLDSSFSKLVARFRETDGHDTGSNTFARDFDTNRIDLS